MSETTQERGTDLFFLVPWYPLSGTRAEYFEEELAREVAPHHPLHGRLFIAVGITGASDDVLFRLDDGTFAQVHLTYTRNPPEGFPNVRRTRLYKTLADWMLAVMLADHVDHFGLWDDGC